MDLAAQGWTGEESKAFYTGRNALANSVTLSHSNEQERLVVYTDASDSIWSGFITQVPPSDFTKPHAEQIYSPLAFRSSLFSSTLLGWFVFEKEAFAILSTMERMHWLVPTSSGFDLYTDHNNLIYIYDPL